MLNEQGSSDWYNFWIKCSSFTKNVNTDSCRSCNLPFGNIFSRIPNTLLIGSIFFSLVTFTRNITAGYVSSLVLIVLLGVAKSITSDIENKTLSAMLEPFGGGALDVLTEYWTPEDQNTKLIPLSGVILWNRLLWLGISIFITALTYYKFKFSA